MKTTPPALALVPRSPDFLTSPLYDLLSPDEGQDGKAYYEAPDFNVDLTVKEPWDEVAHAYPTNTLADRLDGYPVADGFTRIAAWTNEDGEVVDVVVDVQPANAFARVLLGIAAHGPEVYEAAPDLLAACEKAEEILSDCIGLTPEAGDSWVEDAASVLRAAIAAARGEVTQ